MIDLYYWPTPNGHKITIMLEEAGMAYQVKPIDIGRGEQFAADFLRISPNNKIPALVDHAPKPGSSVEITGDTGAAEVTGGRDAPLCLFESGAILLYLAEKSGQFLPETCAARHHVLEWLFWQMAGFGPMLGQNHHFNRYAPEPVPYAIDRYTKETARLYAVLDRQLAAREFMLDTYSIADIATYPWVVSHAAQKQDLRDFPQVQRWFEAMQQRPAVQRAYAVVEKLDIRTEMDEQAKQQLFGQDASVVQKSSPAA